MTDATVTDVTAVRALAHPVRLAILDVLQTHGSATATECALEVDESPQTCSYHLRTLAKSGFVRRVESDDARETRWELVRKSLALSTSSSSSPAFLAAATALQRQVLARDERAVTEFLEREAEFDEEWQEAATFTSGTLVLNAAELEQVRAEVAKVLKRFEARKRKSEGARRVHVVFRAVPRVERKGRQ